MKVINDKRYAEYAGLSRGAIVTDDEFEAIKRSYHEQRDAETRRMFEDALRTAPDHARVVTGPGFMGMRKGTVFYVSEVKGSVYGHWRVQGTKSRMSTFATCTLRAILENSKTVKELKRSAGSGRSSHKYEYRRVTESGKVDWRRTASSVAEVERAITADSPDASKVYAGFYTGRTPDGTLRAYYVDRIY